MKIARLILEDGSQFVGWSFGYDTNTVGEVVFNTAMTGYPESLTDPSYAGQILVTTYPLIGNYGVPSLTPESPTPDPSHRGEGSIYLQRGKTAVLPVLESEKIHVKGLVVADYSEQYSHWNAHESLASWLKREKIPAITGIDTRRLTKVLRESGVMMGRIVLEGLDHLENLEHLDHLEKLENLDSLDYGGVNWVEQVSCKEVITYRPDTTVTADRACSLVPGVSSNSSLFTLHPSLPRVVLVDCGVKANIIN